MGYIKHNAIIATTYDIKLCKKYRNKALKIFNKGQVGKILETCINGYCTLFIGPDGSKEGWTESNDGDANRKLFTEYLKKEKCAFVELSYCDDYGPAKIIQQLK